MPQQHAGAPPRPLVPGAYRWTLLHAMQRQQHQLTQGSIDAQQLSAFRAWLECGAVEDDVAAVAPKVWRYVTTHLLSPDTPLPVHQALLAAVYEGWPAQGLGPHQVWAPSDDQVLDTNVAKFLQTFTGDEEFERCRRLYRQVIPPPSAAGSSTASTAAPLIPPFTAGSSTAATAAPLTSPTPPPHLPRGRGTPAGGASEGAVAAAAANDWRALQALSCREPGLLLGAFLSTQLRLPWHTPPHKILDVTPGSPDTCTWLPGARFNIAHCALSDCRADAVASGGGGGIGGGGGSSGASRAAVIYAAEGQPEAVQVLTLDGLRSRAAHIAACLRTMLKPGDAVAIIMPLTVDAIAIYLGIVLAGCVVVSIADSFSAAEIATRLSISQARLLFTQDTMTRGGKALRLYARVRASPGGPPAVVVPEQGAAPTAPDSNLSLNLNSDSNLDLKGPVQQLRPGDEGLAAFLCRAPPPASERSGSWWEAAPTAEPPAAGPAVGPAVGAAVGGGAEDLPWVASSSTPANILFSSGTTGEPKAIVWTHSTPLRCALDGWAHQDIKPGTVVCWPTSMGWMMGPWLLFATLLNGGTIALYQGSPLGRDFGQFVAAAGVQVLGLVPSIVKAWRASDCMRGLDWSRLRCFSSTGEASSPDDYHWLMSRVPSYRPVIEYCGGTEIGGAFLSCSLLQPQSPSVFSTPTLGSRLVLLGQGGEQSEHRDSVPPLTGELALVPPMLGTSQVLLNRDHTEVYYKGMPLHATTGMPLRRHGDEVERLHGGYYRALGRCDDTMNLGGVKISSVELERAVQQGLPDIVAEAAAIGLPTPGGGPEQLVLVLVLQQGAEGRMPKGGLLAACQREVRERLNPLFKVTAVHVRRELPRTATNKVMRRVLRDELMATAARSKL